MTNLETELIADSISNGYWYQDTLDMIEFANRIRTAAIQECIDRLVKGGKPAEAQMLRHHFGMESNG